jgi:hypothetical protein
MLPLSFDPGRGRHPAGDAHSRGTADRRRRFRRRRADYSDGPRPFRLTGLACRLPGGCQVGLEAVPARLHPDRGLARSGALGQNRRADRAHRSESARHLPRAQAGPRHEWAGLAISLWGAPERLGARPWGLTRRQGHETMICRIWHGWTTPLNADAYERLLRSEIFHQDRPSPDPGLSPYRAAPSRRSSRWVRHLMWFGSIEAVRDFAGADYETAVVPPAARALLEQFDARSVHYEVRQPRSGLKRARARSRPPASGSAPSGTTTSTPTPRCAPIPRSCATSATARAEPRGRLAPDGDARRALAAPRLRHVGGRGADTGCFVGESGCTTGGGPTTRWLGRGLGLLGPGVRSGGRPSRAGRGLRPAGLAQDHQPHRYPANTRSVRLAERLERETTVRGHRVAVYALARSEWRAG